MSMTPVINSYRRAFSLLAIAALAALVLACDKPVKYAETFDIDLYQGGGLTAEQTISLENVLEQGKPVVLNFWAGKCAPCVEEMPVLQYASTTYVDEAVVLGIDIGPYTNLGSYRQGRELLDQLGITYAAGNTDDGAVIRDYGVTVLPTTLFILPDGAIHESWAGTIRWTQLEERIDSLIEANADASN